MELENQKQLLFDQKEKKDNKSTHLFELKEEMSDSMHYYSNN